MVFIFIMIFLLKYVPICSLYLTFLLSSFRMFQDIKVSEDLNSQFKEHLSHVPAKQGLADSVSIKILNVAAWARTTDKVPVTLPRELEDYIPEVEEFYKVSTIKNLSGFFLKKLLTKQK